MAEFLDEEEEDVCSQDEQEEEEEDDEEEYSYESDEEAPPSAASAHAEDVFIVPEEGCVFVNYKDMYPNLLKLANSVSSILGVSYDVAELLLQKCKWNQEQLVVQYFQNPEAALVKAHVVLDPTQSLTSTTSAATDSCFICMDDFSAANGGVFSLACGHKFHRSCYGEYIESNVSDGPTCVEMTCPQFRCPLRISSAVVKELCKCGHEDGGAGGEDQVPSMDRTASGCIVPWGSNVYESFIKHLVKNFIEQSTYMRWCPAPGCVFISVGRGVDQVMCLCGFEYCIKCQKTAHLPASCGLVQKWEEKNCSESENFNWILVNTKPCPKCHRRIEKNQGCNHMTCSVCRHGFCWICMGDWSTHNGQYYNCNKFKGGDEKNDDLKSAKFELDRYMHNFSRYQNHKKALTIAITKKNQLAAGAFQAFTKADIASATANCLREAFEQVVDCRRVLQHSYIVGYYAKNGTSEHQLFEFQQQMLESNTEALNHLTEKVEKEQLSQNEMEHIKNLTGVTKKFMSQMMTADDMTMKVKV